MGFNLFRDKMIGEFFANMPVAPAVVSTVEAKPGAWTPVIQAIGTANASQGVELTVETSGVVRGIHFTSNQDVEKGTLLLQLDDVVQRADVEAARTQLELDRQNLERARELQRRGVATSVSLEQSEAAARASEAQMAKLSAVLEQRQLNAPFKGVVGIPQVDLGGFISPGTTVATLQDLSVMRVDFNVPEQDLRSLSIGQPIRVRTEGGTETFMGDIKGINPRIDPASRLVAVRAAVENPSYRLTPGQFVQIEIKLPEEDNVIALPQTTVVTSLYGDYVFVVRTKADAPDKLEVRQVFVQTGRRVGQVVEITSGLQAGDQIVTAGQNRLTSGMPAVIDNSLNPAVDAANRQTGNAQPGNGQTGNGQTGNTEPGAQK